MASTSENQENKQEFVNPYKPLIYIVAKDYLQPNEITLKPTNETNTNQIVKGNDNNFDLASVVDLIALLTAPTIVISPTWLAATPTVIARLKNMLLDKHDENLDIEEENKELVTSHNKMAQDLEKIDLSDWEDFVEQIPFKSIPRELDFPPGHPLIGRFYRVHPLKNKSNKYIPIEQFDSILYKERESELIKILVDLGATEISIQELSSSKTNRSAEAKASLKGAGGISGDIKGENEKSSSLDQLMKLNPKNWTPENFDSNEYNWLVYEPDWESLVHARLRGGCLSSSIELTSDTSFSISAQLGLTEGILKNLGSLGAGGEFSRLRQEKKRFEVQFIDV